MAPIEGVDEAYLDHCRLFDRYKDDTDFIELVEFWERGKIANWGSIERYNEYHARKELAAKCASKVVDQQ